MEPIVERIENPDGQSFYAARFDINQPCNSSYWHIHAEYELVYIKNGKGPIQVGSYYSKYEDGILIFLGPHIPHMPFTNFDHQDNIEVVIQFKETLLKDLLSKFPEFKKINEVSKLSQSGLLFGHEVRSQLSAQLINLVDLPKPIQLCRLLEILFELSTTKDCLQIGVSGITVGTNVNDYSRVNRIYEYVEGHYKNNISVAEVAEMVGLTTNSFCRFFKKVNQKSFVQFINEFRINKAIEMMNLKDYSISETMYESGFNDPSYFNKQFKKSRGMSPSEYKRELQKA